MLKTTITSYLLPFIPIWLYAEIHYRFRFFPFSRYFKKEPEIISKKKLTRTFSKLRLRLKRYEKDGKRSKYVISAEAETSKGKIIHSEGIDWRFGIALKQTISKLLKQIKR